jgi:hypothetical protein
MSVHQPIYRTGPRQRSQARNLIAGAQQPAQHVFAATEENNDYDTNITVVPCKAQSIRIRCGVTLVPGQMYYMVRSTKFTNRWYLVTKNVRTHAWMCSSREEQVQARCIGKVEAFRAARSTKKAA